MRVARRQRDRRRDEAGVEQEVDRRGADQRAGQRGERHRRAGAAEQPEREAGALHRDDQRRDAEQRAIERVRAPCLFRWHWLNALPAATSIVSCGPSSSSDAKSTAYDTDIVEPLVVSGSVDLERRRHRREQQQREEQQAADRTWTCGQAHDRTSRRPTRPPRSTYTAGGRRQLRSSVDPRRRRHPVVAPVFLEHRPEHLIEVFAAAPDRSAQDAFLHRAQLAQRAVGAPVLQQHARLEPVRAERAERERSDQARGFEEDAAAARRRRERALPFRGFEARIELTDLQDADDGRAPPPA